MAQVYSVTQINSYIKNMVRQDFLLNRIEIKGEISNCKYTDKNGCIFFTLKDENSAIPVVMYGSDAYKLSFRLKDGMSVDRKSTRLNSSHKVQYRMPSSA